MLLEELPDKYYIKQIFNNAYCMADTMVALDKAKYKTVCLATQWYEILIIILLPLSADSLKWSESHGLKNI